MHVESRGARIMREVRGARRGEQKESDRDKRVNKRSQVVIRDKKRERKREKAVRKQERTARKIE